MTHELAKNIGSSLAIKSVHIALVIAYIIMIPISTIGRDNPIKALFWIVEWMKSEFALHIIIGIIVFYACGYYFGGKAGNDILTKQYNYIWVGPLYGLLTLLSAVFLGSLTGFCLGIIHDLHYVDRLSEIRLDMFYDNFINYIFKPIFWFSLFGLIPALLVGLWFGKSIHKKIVILT